MNERDHDDELTPDEREAFGTLPRVRVPPAELEERVVGALRDEALLGSEAGRGPRRGFGPWRMAAAAAAVALFASGVAVGQWNAGRGMARALATLDPPADAAQAATRVQETGSEYVRAVSELADLDPSTADGDRASGAEAARVALHAAALELARVSPDDATLRLVLAVLEERVGQAADSTTAVPRKTIWF